MKPHEGLNFLNASSKKTHRWWLSIEYNHPSPTNTEWIQNGSEHGSNHQMQDARRKKKNTSVLKGKQIHAHGRYKYSPLIEFAIQLAEESRAIQRKSL
jgi:hypothetical protein